MLGQQQQQTPIKKPFDNPKDQAREIFDKATQKKVEAPNVEDTLAKAKRALKQARETQEKVKTYDRCGCW